MASAPHRFFFVVGVVQLALASTWWLCVLGARMLPWWPAPPAAIPATVMHAVVMLYGFAPFFMFGFLFTAGPRWLAVPPPSTVQWLPAGSLAAGAALAAWPLQIAGAGTWVQLAAGVEVVAWLALLGRFVALIRASRQQDKIHATLVAIAFFAGTTGLAVFALAGPAAHPWLRDFGLWGFLIPVFVTVCHRMIPFFTASALPFVTAFRPWWLLGVLVGAPWVHGALALAGREAWTWVVDIPAGVVLLWVCVRWGLVQSLGNRLLAMLHIGFVWYGVGLLLAGTRSLLVLTEPGTAILALAPLHALAIGFLASLVMAMVTRVTCGHSGGTLAADALTWVLFLVLQLAALARVAADVMPGDAPLAAAVVLWFVAVVPWCVRYAPSYWRPRADGRPG